MPRPKRQCTTKTTKPYDKAPAVNKTKWSIDEKKAFLAALRMHGPGDLEKFCIYLPDRSLVDIKKMMDSYSNYAQTKYNAKRRLRAPIEFWNCEVGFLTENIHELSGLLTRVMSVAANLEPHSEPTNNAPDYSSIYMYISEILNGDVRRTLGKKEAQVMLSLFHEMAMHLHSLDFSKQQALMKKKFQALSQTVDMVCKNSSETSFYKVMRDLQEDLTESELQEVASKHSSTLPPGDQTGTSTIIKKEPRDDTPQPLSSHESVVELMPKCDSVVSKTNQSNSKTSERDLNRPSSAISHPSSSGEPGIKEPSVECENSQLSTPAQLEVSRPSAGLESSSHQPPTPGQSEPTITASIGSTQPDANESTITTNVIMDESSQSVNDNPTPSTSNQATESITSQHANNNKDGIQTASTSNETNEPCTSQEANDNEGGLQTPSTSNGGNEPITSQQEKLPQHAPLYSLNPLCIPIKYLQPKLRPGCVAPSARPAPPSAQLGKSVSIPKHILEEAFRKGKLNSGDKIKVKIVHQKDGTDKIVLVKEKSPKAY